MDIKKYYEEPTVKMGFLEFVQNLEDINFNDKKTMSHTVYFTATVKKNPNTELFRKLSGKKIFIKIAVWDDEDDGTESQHYERIVYRFISDVNKNSNYTYSVNLAEQFLSFTMIEGLDEKDMTKNPLVQKIKKSIFNLYKKGLSSVIDLGVLIVPVYEFRGQDGMTLMNLLDKGIDFDRELLEIIFQLMWTFEQLNQMGLRHNDVHLGNIFVIENKNMKSFIYSIGDKKFLLTPKYIPIIYDFDRSTFTLGYRPNKIVKHPTGSICSLSGACSKKNARYDIFKCLAKIYRFLELTKNYKSLNMIETIISKDYLKDPTKCCANDEKLFEYSSLCSENVINPDTQEFVCKDLDPKGNIKIFSEIIEQTNLFDIFLNDQKLSNKFTYIDYFEGDVYVECEADVSATFVTKSKLGSGAVRFSEQFNVKISADDKYLFPVFDYFLRTNHLFIHFLQSDSSNIEDFDYSLIDGKTVKTLYSIFLEMIEEIVIVVELKDALGEQIFD